MEEFEDDDITNTEVNIDDFFPINNTKCGCYYRGNSIDFHDGCERCLELICDTCGSYPQIERERNNRCDFQGWYSHDMEYGPCSGKYDHRKVHLRNIYIKKQWGSYGMPPSNHPLWKL